MLDCRTCHAVDEAILLVTENAHSPGLLYGLGALSGVIAHAAQDYRDTPVPIDMGSRFKGFVNSRPDPVDRWCRGMDNTPALGPVTVNNPADDRMDAGF